jgi:bifunctional DNA-binding transcriptional regulator/antitoxin component of YhaV-PrlF toxin-antitoxin module
MKTKIDTYGKIIIPTRLLKRYGIAGNSPVVLLPVRDGIQISNTNNFIMDQTPEDEIVTVDQSGGFAIPSHFQSRYKFEAKDVLRIARRKTCILIYKDNL